jgi:hypothetical protein
MWLRTEAGETYRIPDVVWQGVTSCPDFTIQEGQTIGEAVNLSLCRCEFCCNIRSEARQGL